MKIPELRDEIKATVIKLDQAEENFRELRRKRDKLKYDLHKQEREQSISVDVATCTNIYSGKAELLIVDHTDGRMFLSAHLVVDGGEPMHIRRTVNPPKYDRNKEITTWLQDVATHLIESE